MKREGGSLLWDCRWARRQRYADIDSEHISGTREHGRHNNTRRRGKFMILLLLAPYVYTGCICTYCCESIFCNFSECMVL